MFEDVIVAFDDYYRLQGRMNAAGFNRDLGCEVRERLQQLDFILRQVREAESSATAATTRAERVGLEHLRRFQAAGANLSTYTGVSEANLTPEEHRAFLDAQFRMKFFAEAFYYFAGRVRAILRHGTAPLPGLTSFESVGVRNVRNKLLEHPEGADSQVFSQSWGWGRSHGPMLKSIRNQGQEQVFPDAGLVPNAKEFHDNLLARLQQVIEASQITGI
jgi:hypothetical protein